MRFFCASRVFGRWVLLFAVAGACGGHARLGHSTEPAETNDSMSNDQQGLVRGPFTYPHTKRVDVVDDYHGTTVVDPYRWLEDTDSDETAAWVKQQNAVTEAFLGTIRARESLRARLTKLWNYERFGVPEKRGGKYFFTKNDGLQDQAVLYWTTNLKDEPRVLLDPNGWSDEGTAALTSTAVSRDGKYIAYGVQRAGSDWQQWKVREIESGKDLPDTIDWVKFSHAVWNHEGTGFYYARYPKPAPGEALEDQNVDQKVYFHRLGTAQAEDLLVYEDPANPKHGFGVMVTEDGKYLLVSTWKGTGRKNLVHYKRLDKAVKNKADQGLAQRAGAEFTPLVTEFENFFEYVGNDGDTFYFFTDMESPRGKLIAIDLRRSRAKAESRLLTRDIIPETEATLSDVSMVGNQFFADYLKDAKSEIRIYDRRGRDKGVVELPGIGSAGGFGGERTHRETFYAFTSFTEPTTIFRYDLRTRKSEVFRKPEVAVDTSQFETQQVFVTSKDGTKLPMFIVHKRGLERNAKNPTLLYGYGGFNVSLTPYFSITRSVWMERGGVLAIPNLRGGGEYGEAWHQEGIKEKKQNTFDDFIAAAEYLIKERYTSPEKLAIQGGSNGGLLVGAVMTQRPELFGAALPSVGVMDMLRFHQFTIGWAWVDDYGSSDDPKMFPVLRAYSPYHNIEEGVSYPATLVMTADHDDRVVPGHSFKFVSALQRAHGGDTPVMIRVETQAGHGAGTPTSKRIAEAADMFAFLERVLGMEPWGDRNGPLESDDAESEEAVSDPSSTPELDIPEAESGEGDALDTGSFE